MKYTVMDKQAAVASPRIGQFADLYKDLVAMMDEAPEKKLLIEFDTVQQGYRAKLKLVEWATEDGLTLYERTISQTTQREMHLEREAPTA